MKIVFFSNYMTHHQLPFCLEMIKLADVEFIFVCTEKIPQQRLDFGYEDLNLKYDFILRAYESQNEKIQAKKLADEADVVIVGSAPMEYVFDRLKKKKLTFRCTERLYKKQYRGFQFIKNALINYWINGRHKSLYLLAASAFASADYKKNRTFINKAYKWGYFTEVKRYKDIQQMVDKKARNSILWAGRLIDCKHPEMAIQVAKKLKQDGYDFTLKIIGNGPLQAPLEQLIKDNKIEGTVELLGALSPNEVRLHMEASEIFLFTSDRNEGWGAVLNEAMNSACVVVASHAIGSVPYLLSNEDNGMIFKDGCCEDLYLNVKRLLDDSEKRKLIGINAYKTMQKVWNPSVAAQRLVDLCKSLSKEKNAFNLFESGPCSKAEEIADDWFLK